MDEKTENLISKIERVQIENPFVLVQGLIEDEYNLIEYFVKRKKTCFRNHDLHWSGYGSNKERKIVQNLIIYNFEVESRFFPESAIEYAEKLIHPYIKEENISKKRNVLIFSKKGSEFYNNGSLNSTNFSLDQRISAFLERFKIINTN